MNIEILKEKRRDIIIVRHNVKLVGHLEITKIIKLIIRDFT